MTKLNRFFRIKRFQLSLKATF